MYFSYFPVTYYTLDDRASIQVVRNIFLRAKINDVIKTNYSLYDEYDVREGETPEIVADKFYNTTQLHWIILYMNDILDPRYDWPLTTVNLLRYCQDKYDNVEGIHHYENTQGYIVKSTYPGAYPVSNYEFEDRLNESKRRIKILKPQFIDVVVNEFVKIFEGVNG